MNNMNNEPKVKTAEEITSAANHHVDMQYPMGVEREYPIQDFEAGANWAIIRYDKMRLALEKIKSRNLSSYDCYDIAEQALKQKE